MRSNFQLLLLLCIIANSTYSQEEQLNLINLGDPAPPLRLRVWLKGEPIQKFEKGTVYIVEFWATWCTPCKAAMPHLSALQGEYKGKVVVLGVDIYERKTTTTKEIKAFVKSMGHQMDYHVATEDSNFMVAAWLDASGEQTLGIPRTFVVNGEGRLAWIGHPAKLNEVLIKILNNTWNIKQALAKRNLEKHLAKVDDSINYELNKYIGNPEKNDFGKPDSALLIINEIVKNEPNLKYAPFIASHTFSSLLKTNMQKALDYGRAAITTSVYEGPLFAYEAIIENIKIYSDKLKFSPKIYQLGAEAYQVKINQIPYPEIVVMYKWYNQMAEWYWRASDKSKAINAEQKAIDFLKCKKDFSKADLASYEFRLQQYKDIKLEKENLQL